MSNYSTAGEGGGHYSKNSNKNFILKNDPGQYIFYGRHYSSLHRLKYTSNTRFLCFNNLWMIKYFLYYWWSISAFYGYIEILGLEVPLKHKNWMSLYLFHGEWISHDFFKNCMACAAKNSFRAIHYVWNFKCTVFAFNCLTIIFCISAFWNTAFSRNWVLECITSVVWYKAAKRKRVLL